MKHFLVSICVVNSLIAAAYGTEPPEKWFYGNVDLLKDNREEGQANFGTREIVELMPKLRDTGYEVMVLSNYYLASIDRLTGNHSDSETLLKNLSRVQKAAAHCGIEIVPEIMSVGASGQVLLNEPHLAEGVPVRDLEMVVHRTDQKITADIVPTEVVIAGEMNCDRTTVGNAFRIDPGSFEMSTESESAEANDCSLHFSDMTHGLFLTQTNLVLRQQHQYQWSFQLKTEGFTKNELESIPITCDVVGTDPHDQRKLHRVQHSLQPSADYWHTYVVSLNSFHFERASVSIDIEPSSTGKVWLDNVSLKLTRPVNLLRRVDLPLTVKTADGTKLEEHTQFAYWGDPNVGLDGHYRPIDEVVPIELFAESGVKHGDRLSVSCFHALLPDKEGERVCCSMLHPGVLEIHRQQVSVLNKLLAPKRWLINHDEIRTACHEPNARSENLTPGSLLRHHLIECLKIIQHEGQNKPVVLVSDMYDPYHNAVDESDDASYFPFVNGSFRDSWRPITNQELNNPPAISIWNWNQADSEATKFKPRVVASFQHFHRLGFPQIAAGFYDVKNAVAPERIRSLFESAKQNSDVRGVCYYTTERNLFHLKTFANIADEVFGAE